MKQDYLWDKSGDDAEIRGLEEALKAYRYQETAAPKIHIEKPIPVVRREPRWRFSFGFAFAGGAVAAVILIGIWFQFLNGQRQTTADVATVSQQQPAPQNAEAKPYSNTSENMVDKTDNTTLTPVPMTTEFRQPARKMARRNLVAAKASSRKDRPVKLTNEEKFAYGQLMLALSITGSKLKMVRDTVNGTED